MTAKHNLSEMLSDMHTEEEKVCAQNIEADVDALQPRQNFCTETADDSMREYYASVCTAADEEPLVK